MDWEIEFYQKENGEIPVEDFLLSLKPKHTATYCCLKSWVSTSANPFQPRSRVNAIKDCLSYG